VINNQYSVLGSERDCVRSTSRSAAAGRRQSFFVIFVFLLLSSTRFALAQSEVVVDFEKAELTGRWIDSWEENGVVFTPAHPPTRGKAKARLMFFPHISSGRKGILSAMATDPIPVRARFAQSASLVTLVLWGSTGCPARLEAYDREGKLVDKASVDAVPSRKAPGDAIPTFELSVKGTNIAYIEFSGPRAGEFLAADEIRFQLAKGASSPATSQARTDFKVVAPLLEKYCTDCHGGEAPKNDVSLEFVDGQDVGRRLLKDYRLFEHMADRIRSGKMPPKKKAQPNEAEKNILLTWIDQELVAALGSRPFGQVARARRLTRVEYANTIRDLFSFEDFKAEDLPPDDIGYGFDNIADLLTVSSGHLEQYLSTAEQVIAQLDKTAKVSRNWAEKDGTYSEPDSGVFLPIRDVKLGFNNNQVRVRMVLEKFLPRAYRRPVAPVEIDRLMEFARLSLAQEGESFIRPKSTYATLRAALSSPYFLYRIEQDPPDGIAPINEYELASRLSYFLWSSMPDDELFNLAKENQLRAHQEEQVRRMLKDRKARALTENFAWQWLHLTGLKKVAPDPKLYPDFNEQLRQDMREETRQFVSHVIGEDRSIMEFLNADYTFLNERLARHYSIEGVQGDEFRQVRLDAQQQRGGLLTQGSILALTSPPTRTSPVKRGVWVLETLFNDPPSPPPADVPPLEKEGTALTGSVRQVLEKHRANAQCAGCHSRIDPYGLALENYNAIGVWRTKERDQQIDSSGTMPDGTAFRNMAEFRALLNDQRAEFRRALVEKLLIYAQGRGLEYADHRAVREICADVEHHDDRFSAVILAIVQSDLFQKRQSKEEPSTQAKGNRP
jgi:hypothetical protein